MSKLHLGQVEYLNCIPVYHALEEGLSPLDVKLVKGPPAQLNRLFLSGELDITPISSIEYARNKDKCVILPKLSISADGRVESVLLFSRLPVTELEGRKVCVTSSSATSVVLLKILFEHYYHVDVEFITVDPDLDYMLSIADAALLIGDDAMLAHHRVLQENLNLNVTDLGEVWKQFTGERMVYALWVIRREFAVAYPDEVTRIANLLYESKMVGLNNMPALLGKAKRRCPLPVPVLEDYFLNVIQHEFTEEFQHALLTYYDYAYKSGVIEERVKLNIWSEGIE
ncbi:menaquinone biosynthetic enzyme MqnA/MqnD family protein [Desulfolucanica intricata]|uniref:menaquinone biosynthetic enzyme MqnA/MqnD family protein n=1 Tax=Desulfolucanica intricata TaxID=1285191 RepID=UPI0008300794|nr:menaquinone biosynthesis protein [Desulfolucanica intricata]